jgi:hypothetical protein
MSRVGVGNAEDCASSCRHRSHARNHDHRWYGMRVRRRLSFSLALRWDECRFGTASAAKRWYSGNEAARCATAAAQQKEHGDNRRQERCVGAARSSIGCPAAARFRGIPDRTRTTARRRSLDPPAGGSGGPVSRVHAVAERSAFFPFAVRIAGRYSHDCAGAGLGITVSCLHQLDTWQDNVAHVPYCHTQVPQLRDLAIEDSARIKSQRPRAQCVLLLEAPPARRPQSGGWST